MDIEKFYNNIISEKSAKIIRKMWEESELVIEGIDTRKEICKEKGQKEFQRQSK